MGRHTVRYATPSAAMSPSERHRVTLVHLSREMPLADALIHPLHRYCTHAWAEFSIADRATKALLKKAGPERKFRSFTAVRACGLPGSVNLRSGQRDYRIYSGGRSIRP